MKKISTYLFLILFSFSAPSFADDISEFQIEGISIGDSLLNHFSKEKIENSLNYDDLPSDMKFRITEITSSSFDLYNFIQFFHKPNDKNFIIFGMDAGIYYAQNINKCYKKQLDIVKERLSSQLFLIFILFSYSAQETVITSPESKYKKVLRTLLFPVGSHGNTKVSSTFLVFLYNKENSSTISFCFA